MNGLLLGMVKERGFTVLLAEDEAIFRRKVEERLKKYGFKVSVASGGASAWKAYQKGSFDLVITDQVMPGLSGVDLVKRIKNSRPEQPCIFLTAMRDDLDVQKASWRSDKGGLAETVYKSEWDNSDSAVCLDNVLFAVCAMIRG